MCANFLLAASSELGARDGAGSPDPMEFSTERADVRSLPGTPGVRGNQLCRAEQVSWAGGGEVCPGNEDPRA